MIFSLKNNRKPIDKINRIGFINNAMPFNYLKIPNINNNVYENKTFFSLDNKIKEKYKDTDEINNKHEINNEDKYYKIIYPTCNIIKKIFIFTPFYTIIFANNLKKYFYTLNIETTIYEKVITDEIINMCVNDPNLYLFIICPQKIFKNYIENIPQNKYILYQTEQYNQANIPKINDILLENSLCIFDYSENNLNYFNNIIRKKIHILSPLIDKKIIYSTTKKDIDILFIGSLNERRKTIINKIREYIEKNNLNYNFINLEKTFADDLYRIIKRARCIINLHYYKNSLFEVFRIHDMLNYDCKIVSEKPEMQEELYLIDKYNKIIDFFPIIKDDFSNIDFLYEVIEKNLKNRSNISEREKYEFIKTINSESEKILDNNILYNNIINNSIDKINDKNDFRNICNLNLGIIKNVLIPNIQLNKEYETFYIEFRKFRHSEFLIRNIIIKLPEWSHTVICGNLNYEFMKNICNRISENIKIIKLNIDNLNTAEYSRLLMSKEFWNNFNGEKLLLYQEDSYMFHNRIDEFLKYDYVGAPWPIHQDEHINQKEYGVGNGGFSLRSKSKMIEVINKVDWQKNLKLGPMLTQYMKNTNNYIIPEDVYFSKSLLEKNIGKVATRNVAINFSQETQKSPDPLGGHNFFLADNNKLPNYNRLFLNNENYYKTVTHRGGWKSIIQYGIDNSIISINNNSKNIILEDCCESNFLWNDDCKIINNKWIGITHFTNNVPTIWNMTHIDNLLKNNKFIESLKNCNGLIVLSKYMKNYFKRVKVLKNIRIYNLKHPIDNFYNKFDLNKFLSLKKFNLILLGQQLRKIADISIVNSDLIENKLWLSGITFENVRNERLYKDLLYNKIISNNEEFIEIKKKLQIPYISNYKDYDVLLTSSIILIPLYNASANNSVLEIIQTNTPAFITRLSATEEYLGKDYPMFYDDIIEVNNILNNRELFNKKYTETYNYLKDMDKSHLTYERFYSDLLKIINDVY